MLQIQASRRQRELINKSWENFVARTSNYEAMKVRNLMEQKIYIHDVFIIIVKFQTHFLMNYVDIQVEVIVNFLFTQT